MDGETISQARVIVGLGNPGRRYIRTRHNLGYMVADGLAQRWGFGPGRKAFGGQFVEGRAAIPQCPDEAPRVMLLKPLTYMNHSGQAVKGLVAYYNLAPQNVLIVLDDMDLATGRIRIRPGGSAGGHKGLADILALLATSDVPRLRIGIGAPPGQADTVDFVLGRFTDEESSTVQEAVTMAQQAIEDWLVSPLEDVMGKYNGMFIERKVGDE